MAYKAILSEICGVLVGWLDFSPSWRHICVNMSDKKRKKEEMPELMSPHQAAEALGVTPSAVFHALRRGRLRAMHFGEVKLIPRTELERYKATRKVGRPVGWTKRKDT